MSFFYTRLSRTSYYENSPSKSFFPTSRLTQEKEKSSTDELPTRFAVKFFFVLRVAQVKKVKDFFSDELHTRARTWKPLSPPGLVCCRKKGGREKEKKKTKEGVLSPQEGDVRMKKRKRPRKSRRRLPRRQGSVCPQPRISFLVHEYLGSERPISVEVSAPTRLSLQGSNVRRKFWQQTTLCSKSSTLKGLLYAPIKQEQYHKRTTLHRLKSLCKLFVARKAALSPWSEA